MDVEIREEAITDLAAHKRVPIAFSVSRRMRVEAGRLVEECVEPAWTKDYDVAADGGPERWAARFDVSRWGLLVARREGRRVGGAVVAWDTPGVDMLRGRDDLAVLWDLRVDPASRREGIGASLFEGAAVWARDRGCVELEVETQDINVPACRFYARQGCELHRVDPEAYPALPDETLLLWTLDLGGWSCARSSFA